MLISDIGIQIIPACAAHSWKWNNSVTPKAAVVIFITRLAIKHVISLHLSGLFAGPLFAAFG